MDRKQDFDQKAIINAIFRIDDERKFNALALEIFHFQYWNNPVYRKFCDLLYKDSKQAVHYKEFPFLPAEFFRDQTVVTGKSDPEARVFVSSSTTVTDPARHIVPDLSLYEKSFTDTFRYFYGDPLQYCFLALLPGYLERPGSSLVYMMDRLVRMTGRNGSGFYLDNMDRLARDIQSYRKEGKKIILFGVTFALMDLAENYPMDLEGVIIMETGGMKGRRREIVREELHELLCKAFNVSYIHSEYGMTELLTQAYSQGKGLYRYPPWMKVVIRDVNDPLTLVKEGDTGGISVIDLANVYSCAFIATQDLGRLNEDGSFEVLGRFDNSDLRGCTLMLM